MREAGEVGREKERREKEREREKERGAHLNTGIFLRHAHFLRKLEIARARARERRGVRETGKEGGRKRAERERGTPRHKKNTSTD